MESISSGALGEIIGMKVVYLIIGILVFGYVYFLIKDYIKNRF